MLLPREIGTRLTCPPTGVGRTLYVGLTDGTTGNRALLLITVCAGEIDTGDCFYPVVIREKKYPGSKLGRLVLLTWLGMFISIRVSLIRGSSPSTRSTNAS